MGNSASGMSQETRDSHQRITERYDDLSSRPSFPVCERQEDNRQMFEDLNDYGSGLKDILYTGNPVKDIKPTPAKAYQVADLTYNTVSLPTESEIHDRFDRIEYCMDREDRTRYNPMANHDCTHQQPMRFSVPKYKDPSRDPFMMDPRRPRNGF